MKINKTNIAKYTKKPTTDVMDCGYYAIAIDGDEMYLGDYHLNSNSWSQWRDQHQAYVNIYDNGRCQITVGDNAPSDIWYDGNVADWRAKILDALRRIANINK